MPAIAHESPIPRRKISAPRLTTRNPHGGSRRWSRGPTSREPGIPSWQPGTDIVRAGDRHRAGRGPTSCGQGTASWQPGTGIVAGGDRHRAAWEQGSCELGIASWQSGKRWPERQVASPERQVAPTERQVAPTERQIASSEPGKAGPNASSRRPSGGRHRPAGATSRPARPGSRSPRQMCPAMSWICPVQVGDGVYTSHACGSPVARDASAGCAPADGPALVVTADGALRRSGFLGIRICPRCHCQMEDDPSGAPRRTPGILPHSGERGHVSDC
jgi:hypothetical protein